MGYRRSPDRVSADRDWKQFVHANAELVASAGLPTSATSSIAAWDEFLMHGYIVGDSDSLLVDQLTPHQYHALVHLTWNYFAAGYEFYTPLALRFDDQALLRARFDAIN